MIVAMSGPAMTVGSAPEAMDQQRREGAHERREDHDEDERRPDRDRRHEIDARRQEHTARDDHEPEDDSHQDAHASSFASTRPMSRKWISPVARPRIMSVELCVPELPPVCVMTGTNQMRNVAASVIGSNQLRTRWS